MTTEGNVLISEPMEVIKETGDHCSGSVIFLHGSGDTGQGLSQWIRLINRQFSFPHIRILFPTAPMRPYTLNGGMPSNVWFDRQQLTPHGAEHMETTDATAKELVNIVNQEVKRGVPLNRIVVGGFSMGGAMSLHIGYRYLKGIAGVFALSSFLSTTSCVYKQLGEKKTEQVPPLLMCHGTADDLILEPWGKDTFSKLSNFGVVGEYYSFPGLSHELNTKELQQLSSWIHQRIPEQENKPE